MDVRPFSITVDHARKLMTIGFESVFWTEAVANQFVKECLAAVAQLDARLGGHVILIDLRDAVLQTQDVYDKMKLLIAGATASRIALVAQSPIARMQTKRLQLRETILMFDNMRDAQDWLFGEASRQVA